MSGSSVYLPENEAGRLEALRSYRVLDTPPEEAFDDLARLAAYICGTPIALIGLVDADRQWFKAAVGWEVHEIPRKVSFCSRTVLQSDLLIIPDILKDPQAATSLLATQGGMRFYAGASLLTSEGYAIGTLCVMDCMPRALTEEQSSALQRLACQVVAQLELRRTPPYKAFSQDRPVEMPESKGSGGVLRESEALYRTVTETASDAIIVIDEDSQILFVNRSTERIFGYLKEDLLGQSLTMLMPDYLRQVHRQAVKKYIETGKRHLSWEGVELTGLHKSGKEIWLQISFGEIVRDGKHIFTGICRDISERKRLEHERFQLAAIVESSGDAIIGKDLDGIITSWNKGAERIYGYSAEEVVGKHAAVLTLAEHANEIARIMEKLRRGERIEPYETVRVTKSGERILISLTVSPIRDENGRIVGASAVGRDITERQRSEEKLRVQESRLRLLIEQLPAALWTTNTDLRITSSTGAGWATLDWNPDQIVGMSLFEYFQTDDPHFPPLASHLRALQGETASYEMTGKDRTFEVRVEPLRDAEGRIVECISAALDVTARKQAEEALRASEKRYRSLFEGVVHGIYRVSVDGQFLEVNPALAAMLGYDSPDEVLQLDAAKVYVDPEERSRLVQKWLATDRIEDEVNWRRRNGEVIRVRLSGRPLTDQQNVVQGLEFIVEDVTSRRSLEEQLRQAQKIEALGHLAGGMAHEFNNFLGIIMGYTELLAEEKGVSESLRRKLAEIKAATQRAASLTRQLLAFGRRQMLEPRVLDINTVVWETHKLLRRLMPENIDLVSLLDPALKSVKADPAQIQQILINLVVNARDAMPDGGKVVIETANVELDEEHAVPELYFQPGDYVMLAVTDNGLGMNEETRAKVFEPFFTTKQEGKGTGLGLATVYGIVRQSGGYTTVESRLGKGTTFRVYLPRTEAGEFLPEEASPPAQEETLRGTETVLVVEDENGLRKLICASLERHGYNMLTAKDGAEALQILEQYPGMIHLVVSDIMMPRLNGLQLREQAAPLRPGLKFLFISGYMEVSMAEQQLPPRDAAYLEKPFLPVELARKVRELVEEPSKDEAQGKRPRVSTRAATADSGSHFHQENRPFST